VLAGKPLKIVNAILSGFALPDPKAGEFVGRPSGITAAGEAVPVHFQDVRILSSSEQLQEYLAVFAPLTTSGKAYTVSAVHPGSLWRGHTLVANMQTDL
jgi:hypothetical protein